MQTTASSRLLRSAQKLPIHIGAQVFATNLAIRFALDVDADRFSKIRLYRKRLAEIGNCCPAPNSETGLLRWRQAVQVCAQSFHTHMLPVGNSQVNTCRLFTRTIQSCLLPEIQTAKK